MATLTLDKDECGEGFLPPVCIRCGEAATGVRKQTFHWHPWAIFLSLLICLPVFIILVIVTKKSVTVALPVCDRHRNLWIRRTLLQAAGILYVVCGVFGGITFGNDIDKALRTNGVGAAITIVGIITGLVLIALSSIGTIQAKRITNDTVTLKGLSPVFCETVEQYRILLDDED